MIVASVAVASTPTPDPPVAAATPSPPNGVKLEISVNGDALQFTKKNFEVPAGTQVTLRVHLHFSGT